VNQRTNPELDLTRNERAPLLEEGLDPAEWFTARTLAAYWGVHTSTVKAASDKGKIPVVKYRNRNYYNRAAALLAWRPPKVTRKLENARGVELLVKIEESYLLALADTVTREDWVSIVTVAVNQAKKGEWRARKWIADYLLGTPVHRVAAEVDMGSRKGYSDDQRAAAVTALLELVRSRGEDEVVDVTGTPVIDGEESS